MATIRKDNLTIKQIRFVEEYLRNGMNASAAAIYAGYSKKTAGAMGHENLNKPKIKKYIQRRVRQILGAQDLATLKVFSQMQAIAGFDLRNVLEWDGNGVRVKPSHELDDQTAYALREIKIKETIKPTTDALGGYDEEYTREIEFKGESKTKALEMIAKYLKMFDGDIGEEDDEKDDKGLSPSDRREMIASLHHGLYGRKNDD